MIQIIQVPAAAISRLQQACFFIGIVKSPGETAEKLCHGDIRLRMAHIGRRVDEPGPAVVSGEKISRPQVSVQQGRPFRFHQKIPQPVQQPPGLLSVSPVKIALRTPKLRFQPAVPEKRDPAFMGRIGLRAGADEIIPAKAVFARCMAAS